MDHLACLRQYRAARGTRPARHHLSKTGAIIIALITAAAFAACSPAQKPAGSGTPAVIEITPSPAPAATAAPVSTPAPVPLLLFVPDETEEGLTAAAAQGEDSPQGLIAALVSAGALPEVDYGKNITCTVAEEQLVYEELTYTGKFVHLDLSDAFANAVKAAGADGERLMLQSLVNTFLARYQADALVLSIEGTDLETVSERYDRPIAFDEFVKTSASDTPAP